MRLRGAKSWPFHAIMGNICKYNVSQHRITYGLDPLMLTINDRLKDLGKQDKPLNIKDKDKKLLLNTKSTTLLIQQGLESETIQRRTYTAGFR